MRSSIYQPDCFIALEPSIKRFRTLFVIKGEQTGKDMIFAKRLSSYLKDAGVIIRSFSLAPQMSTAKLLKEYYRLREEIKAFKPDIIHAQYGTITAFLTVIATSIPVVVTYRGSDLNPCPSISQVRWAMGYTLSQIAALRAKRIICVSDELKRRLWAGKSKVTVIPSGVDTRAFSPRAKEAARAELGWGKEERIVLFNGAEPGIKRLDLAQSALKMAENILGEVGFLVLNGSVDPDKIPTMMNAADCLLLTSNWEGSPTVVQEALACNLPVVSVNVGDVETVLAKDRVSKIVPRDPMEIGKALAEILIKNQRSNGVENIDKFSLEHVTRRTMLIYQEVLSEAP
jgi:teichuronic acid biosynthesis glycosyltransferase TuaC